MHRGLCPHAHQSQRREEFLAAMKVLQHGLSDSEMALALSCMDSHGFITPEQVCVDTRVCAHRPVV